MTTFESKPKKIKVLNAKMLTVAAILLVVLALLFLATPILRLNRVSAAGRGNFPRTFNGQTFNGQGGTGGQTFPGFGGNGGTGGTGQTNPGGTNTFPGTGTGGTGSGNGFQFQRGTGTGRAFGGRSGLLGLAFLSGVTGTIVYAFALILALVAAAGMLFTKAWGKLMGIIMAVIYLILGVVSLLPTILLSAFGVRNPLTIVLGVVHILLAIAVIVFAALPGKKVAVPLAEATTPPAMAA